MRFELKAVPAQGHGEGTVRIFASHGGCPGTRVRTPFTADATPFEDGSTQFSAAHGPWSGLHAVRPRLAAPGLADDNAKIPRPFDAYWFNVKVVIPEETAFDRFEANHPMSLFDTTANMPM
ncbi:MAG: hypothetical protein JJ920_11605 [Roseitalea sp.]|nr:hypothetical protein [Roseitalea sp.]MBO6721661.1 hypothetical protein [Roseitalea sp.]MBO6743551.1 hypothetical protein [Roseitalea sp.]